MVDCHLPLFPVHMKPFPALLAFHQKIGAEKGIAAYLKSDKRPSNFWGSDWLAGAQLLSALHSLLSWRLNRGSVSGSARRRGLDGGIDPSERRDEAGGGARGGGAGPAALPPPVGLQ